MLAKAASVATSRAFVFQQSVEFNCDTPHRVVEINATDDPSVSVHHDLGLKGGVAQIVQPDPES